MVSNNYGGRGPKPPIYIYKYKPKSPPFFSQLVFILILLLLQQSQR